MSMETEGLMRRAQPDCPVSADRFDCFSSRVGAATIALCLLTT